MRSERLSERRFKHVWSLFQDCRYGYLDHSGNPQHVRPRYPLHELLPHQRFRQHQAELRHRHHRRHDQPHRHRSPTGLRGRHGMPGLLVRRCAGRFHAAGDRPHLLLRRKVAQELIAQIPRNPARFRGIALC